MRQLSRSTKTRPATSETLKTGEVAKASGVGIETLRFYEKSGLLDQPSRTESGYRLYDTEVLDRLDFIKRAQIQSDQREHVETAVLGGD